MKKEERCNYENYVKSLVIEQEVLETARLKGVAEGLTEGEAKGLARGKAELLKRQLTRRFGQLPDWAIAIIEVANIEQLELWAEAIFDAKSIEELLK